MSAALAVLEKTGKRLPAQVRSFRFINSTKIWGGEERFVFDLAAGLKTMGHSVSVYGRPETEFLSRIAAAGLETCSVYPKFDYDFLPLRKFGASSAEEGFVAITPRDFKLLRMLAFFHPQAKVFWHLGVAYPEPSWEYRWLLKKGNLRLITPSEFLKSRILADFPSLADRILVLPNGVGISSLDAGRARQGLSEKFGISPDKVFLGIFSRLTGWKGHLLLFQALRIVKKENVGFHLWVVGGGEEERFKKEAEDLEIANQTTFTGHQTDVMAFMAGVDMVLLPSQIDYSPYAVLEAMALGKTVLASGVGGLPEMIRSGEDGRLLPPGPPEAWASAVVELARNARRREGLGEAARRSVKEKFSLERMISGFLDIVNADSAIGRS